MISHLRYLRHTDIGRLKGLVQSLYSYRCNLVTFDLGSLVWVFHTSYPLKLLCVRTLDFHTVLSNTSNSIVYTKGMAEYILFSPRPAGYFVLLSFIQDCTYRYSQDLNPGYCFFIHLRQRITAPR